MTTVGARSSAPPSPAALRDFRNPRPDLDGKTILVTGGTGSFGRAFVEAVAREFTPKKLIVFSRDELKQFEMSQAFPADRYPYLRWFIGDVRDYARLEQAMRGVDHVVHAAALKHVSIAEYNPFECIKTNVLGAENVISAAIARDVQSVVTLSTDKAVNPINLYGASKLAADKLFVAAEAMAGDEGPRFFVVRYGNVLGSRGSVAPMFRKLKQQGAASVTITDPRMSRFWITVEQGVNFCLSSMAMARGSEIFVPKIPSLKIVDLARAIAPGLEQKVVGARPGEKLHEMLATEDDARTTLELDDRFIVLPHSHPERREQYVQEGARPVADDFRYASETNPEWLDDAGIQAMIGRAFPEWVK